MSLLATTTDPKRAVKSYARFIVRHRRAVMLLVALLSVLLSFGITRLRFEVDPDRTLPQEHPYIQALNEMHRLFGDKNLVVIGLTPQSGDPFNPAFLTKIHEITEDLARIPAVVPALLTSIASPALMDAFADGDDISIEPLMREPPRTAEEAREIRRRVLSNPDFVGPLLSENGSSLAIYATLETTEALPAYGDISRAVTEVLERRDDGTFTWALSGPVIMAAAVGEYAGRLVRFFPAALLVIGLVLFDAFRSLQAIVLPLTTALLAVVWAVGLMGLLGVSFDPFNATTPILILAIAAGHAVQILKRYYEDYGRLGDSEEAVVASIAEVGPVTLAAGTIATLSFFSLLSFGTESIRTFGVFTGLGILSTLAIELTLIPAIRAVLPPPTRREAERERGSHRAFDCLLSGLARALRRRSFRMGVLAVVAGLVVLCAILFSWLRIDTSFRREFLESSPVYQQDERLNRLFAGTSTLVFLIEGPDEGAVVRPEALAAIDRFERRMEEQEGVGKALSVVDTIRRIHYAFRRSGDESRLPTSTKLVEQYLFLYRLSASSVLSTVLTSDSRIAKVVVFLRDDSTDFGVQTIATAKRLLEEELPAGFRYRISGSLASNGALTDVMVEGKLWNIVQILAIAALVASLLLRSLLAGLLVAAPLVVAVMVNFGVMAAFDVPLDIITSMVGAMAVGIGADYAVYLLFRLRAEVRRDPEGDEALERTLLSSGKAILFVSTAIAAGFATLCFSSFRMHILLGTLVAAAMLSASFSTLTILPALVLTTGWGRSRRSTVTAGESAVA